MSKEEKFGIGTEVDVEGYGVGRIVGIYEQKDAKGDYNVFSVELENGEIRHFTLEQLD